MSNNEQQNCCGTTCDKQAVAEDLRKLQQANYHLHRLLTHSIYYLRRVDRESVSKSGWSEGHKELERQAKAALDIQPPQTTHQLCERVDTTRRLLSELVDNAPGKLYFDLNEVSGGWMTVEQFKEKHGDDEL